VLLTDDMRQQADKLKNEGNEFVKQEKYKEALEAYNAAIQIDGNNAIYYCNRLVIFQRSFPLQSIYIFFIALLHIIN
jgi:tetratricopeptide (TPR) repeat protein